MHGEMVSGWKYVSVSVCECRCRWTKTPTPLPHTKPIVVYGTTASIIDTFMYLNLAMYKVDLSCFGKERIQMDVCLGMTLHVILDLPPPLYTPHNLTQHNESLGSVRQ